MMRDVIPANELLSRAHAIGQYYGFTPLSALAMKPRSRSDKKETADPLKGLSLDPVAETVAKFLHQCRDIEQVPSTGHPLFVWHTNIAPGRPAQRKATIQFHALGTDRAIADAVIIRSLVALARDLYHEEPTVRVNSMGDKETRARYARELSVFFKRRAADLDPEYVERARSCAFDAAERMIAHESGDDLPAPTEHLSDASRKRFEDFLEYLEMTETPYELAKNLVSRGGIWNDVCFEILIGEKRVAWGSRYNDLARRFFPGTMTATGAVFQVASSGPMVKKVPTPRLRFHFVHIGDEAKRVSIKLADEFRKARLPLAQHIGIESLTSQLALVERTPSPYLLVMGRKEALEGSAILRDRATQAETVIPLASLVERLHAVA